MKSDARLSTKMSKPANATLDEHELLNMAMAIHVLYEMFEAVVRAYQGS